jgi:hypothetical protein
MGRYHYAATIHRTVVDKFCLLPQHTIVPETNIISAIARADTVLATTTAL